MDIIKAEIKRLFSSYKFYISIVVGMILFLHPIFSHQMSWQAYSPMQLLSLPLGISDFSPFAVIFCVLPFSDSFCEDYCSGYYRLITLRVGAWKYALNRSVSVALSGMITMSIIMFSAIILSIVFAGQTETAETASFITSRIWGNSENILAFNGMKIYMNRLILFSLFGALWALMGLVVSTICVNKYITLIIPFVIYQTLWYFLGNLVINPIYFLKANHPKMTSLLAVILYQLFWIFLLGVLSAKGIVRRAKI